MSESGWRRVRWSRKKKAAFLDHLAGSCNVVESAEAAGVPVRSVYTLRRKDAGFRDDWHEALLSGYEMLETAMVGYALAGGNAARTVVTGAGRTIDVDVALRLLSSHRNALLGKWRGGPKLRRALPEETDAAILKKLAVIERGRAAEAAGAVDAAMDAAEASDRGGA